MSKDKQLTPIQRRFVDEYVIDLNGTQAAIRAGYSPKTARSIASENLTRPAVRAAIQTALQKQEGPSHARLAELTSIAFGDPRDQKHIHCSTRTDPITGRTVKSVSVKFVDRSKILKEILARLTFQ